MIYMYVQKPLLCGQWRKSRYKINIIHQKSNNHLPKNHGIYCEINGIWGESESLPFDFSRCSAWQ